MPLSTVARRMPPAGVQMCGRCAQQLRPFSAQLQRPRRQPRQSADAAAAAAGPSSGPGSGPVLQAQQRRHMSGHAFGKYGPKYTAKIEQANREWEDKAVRIKEGLEQHVWDTFEERGYVKDVAGNPDDIRKLLLEKRTGAYVGIDPTAPSLHVGHLLPLMPLFWLYINGFRAVTLIGGATARVGDPTGRLTTRDQLKSGDVSMNMIKIHYQLKKLWVNVDAQARRYGYIKTWAWRRGILQNGHWWNKLPLMTVLMRLGSAMRIGPMLSRDSVKRKLTDGDGVSFAEFTYPLMQAWDWWHMYFAQSIQLQIGGSDQFGNIVTGVDAFKIIRDSEPNPAERLPQRGYIDDPVGFTVPLLTDGAGNKLGKTAGNAVWLDRFDTPVYECYGYFMRRPDADVETLLKLFTFIPVATIARIMEHHRADPTMRLAQHVVAFEVTSLVHGMADADAARRQHWARYRKGLPTGEDILATLEAPKHFQRLPDDIDEAYKSSTTADAGADADAERDLDDGSGFFALPDQKTPVTLNNAPRVDMQLPRALIEEGKIARILYAARLATSISDGNRIAVQKGAYVGASPGQKAHVNKGMSLLNMDYTPVHLWFPQDTKNFIINDRYLVLRKGKHNVRIIEIVSDERWRASGKTYPGEPYTGRLRQMRQELKELHKLQEMRQELLKEMDDDDAPPPATAAVRVVRGKGKGKITFPETRNKKLENLRVQIERARGALLKAGVPAVELEDTAGERRDPFEDLG